MKSIEHRFGSQGTRPQNTATSQAKSQPSIVQDHQGSGDNIAGNKTVNNYYSPPPTPTANDGNTEALQLWTQKLTMYRKEEAIASDPEQKFQLKKKIQECKQKIQELEKQEEKIFKNCQQSNHYIERPPIEEQCHQELSRPGGLIRLKAPKRMGKTHLMNWLFERMSQSQEYTGIVFDFNEPESGVVADLDELLQYFCSSLSLALDLPDKLDEFWQKKRAKTLKCRAYFEKEILKSVEGNLIIAIDNIDRLFEEKYQETSLDFFGMLRSWYGNAQTLPNWQKLRLILVYSTEDLPNLGMYQSPFNVGKEIKLSEFTSEQIKDLVSSYGLNLSNEDIGCLMELVGGHPYLIHEAINYLATYPEKPFSEMLVKIPTDEGIYYQHFQSYWKILESEADLALALQKIMMSDVPTSLSQALIFKLESLGLIGKHENLVYPRYKLYQDYFRSHIEQLKEIK
ncbi:AAA-like domain-containing protein [Crocosphaera sp. Alani8]|uniref:AAA-like domain-containing protein n=1 Tax=Crocosphaera sp. Alani8 TaxID=3038952 RepID=UPI00313DB261